MNVRGRGDVRDSGAFHGEEGEAKDETHRVEDAA